MKKIPLEKAYISGSKHFAEICTNCGAPTNGLGKLYSTSIRFSFYSRGRRLFTLIPFCKSCLEVKTGGTKGIMGCYFTAFIIAIFWALLWFFLAWIMDFSMEPHWWINIIFIPLAIFGGLSLRRVLSKIFGSKPTDPELQLIRHRMFNADKDIQLVAQQVSKSELTFFHEKALVEFYLIVNNDEWANRIIAGKKEIISDLE